MVPTPSSPMLITGGAGGQSQIWDPETGREVGPALKGLGSLMPGVGAVLLEDGRYAAASVRKDGEVILRDPLSGAKLARPFGRQMGQVVSVAFAPDGSWVAIGGEHMVRIWDSRAARPIGDPLRFVERSVCVVAPVHLPDGGFAVGIGLVDGRIQIWSVDSGVLLGETEPSHSGPGFDTREIQAVCSLSCPGGPVVVAASKKRGVRVWSTSSILGRVQQNRRSDVTALAVVPVEAGDPLIACAFSGGLLELTDATTGTVVRSLDVSPQGSVVSLAAGLRDDQSLVAAVTEGELVVVNAVTGKVVAKHRLGWFPGAPQIVLSPDGASLVVAIHTYLYVLDLVMEGQSEFRTLAELPYAIEGMTFVSVPGEGAVLAATVADGTIHRVLSGTGDKLEPFPSLGRERPAVLCAGILHSDQHVLILVDVAGTVFVLDPSTGILLQEPHRTGCRTRSATAYVHDQQLVVALGGFDGTVLLVNIEQGSEVARGQGHLDSVTHMTVLARADGPQVISAGADGAVFAWESSLRRSPL